MRSLSILCCLAAALFTVGCSWMLGMPAERSLYREKFSTSKKLTTADHLEHEVGVPDHRIPYDELEEFITNETLRNRIINYLAEAIEIPLTPEETVQELRKLESGGYKIWFYDEAKHFHWTGYFPPSLRIFLIDPDDNIVIFTGCAQNEPLEKERLRNSPDTLRPNTPEEFGIFKAANIEDWNTVRAMLKIQPRLVLSKRYSYDWTLLHMATMDARPDIVEFLIGKGADVGSKDSTGKTPLHWVANYLGGGNSENSERSISGIKIAKLLIASGANVNAKTDKGETPLKIAKGEGFREMIDLLQKHGAKK